MSRSREAPDNLDCPYRHKCPHLDQMSASWVMEIYQEAFKLREQLHAMEQRYEQRLAELEKTLAERDQKIAQLRLQHQKQFKANGKPVAVSPEAKPRKRGAPVGHPPWRRRELTHVDQVVPVPPPEECPHCHGHDLLPCPDLYAHVQEDIILAPRVHVTQFVHGQCICQKCRRVVYRVAPENSPAFRSDR